LQGRAGSISERVTTAVQILIGDVRAKLKELPDESVQCVVTSPPYWGLRDYGTEPQLWGGAPDCAHEWGDEGKIHKGGPRALGRSSILVDLNPANEAFMRARIAKGLIARKTKKPRKCETLELLLEDVA
jgi:hypothetical protein